MLCSLASDGSSAGQQVTSAGVYDRLVGVRIRLPGPAGAWDGSAQRGQSRAGRLLELPGEA
jgi:hypothetical protein